MSALVQSKPQCPACGGDVVPFIDFDTDDLLVLQCRRSPTCPGRAYVRNPDNARCSCGRDWILRQNQKTGGWFLGCSAYSPRGCKGSRSLDVLPPYSPLSNAPTDEQAAVLERFGDGRSKVIQALAGTGKTTTLRMLAERNQNTRFQYIVFNKAMQIDAERKFPANVSVKTAHALAFAHTRMSEQRERISRYVSAQELVLALGCDSFQGEVGGAAFEVEAEYVAEFARATVALYVKDDVEKIGPRHVEFGTGKLPYRQEPPLQIRAILKEHVVSYAEVLWALYCDHDPGGIGYGNSHDIYLKRWQLSDPHVDADAILYDEGQDADAVMLSILANQGHAEVIVCGDSNQAIYEWRGAVDALDAFASALGRSTSEVDQLWLTQSFRFGPAVATEAQRLLQLLECPRSITGSSAVSSTVGVVERPDALVCRTNKGVLDGVGDALDGGRRPHILGDGNRRGMLSLASAAARMQKDQSFDHPALNGFGSWGDVVDWAYRPENAMSDDASTIRAIADNGVKRVLFLLSKHVEEEAAADVVITNVHQAKGREWPKVKLAPDFRHPLDLVATGATEELRIAYVAVTRAIERLDLGAGLWNAPRREKAESSAG